MRPALFDANVIVPHLIETEASKVAQRCFDSFQCVSLDFARIETASALAKYLRAGHLPLEHVVTVMNVFSRIPLEYGAKDYLNRALDLSHKFTHGLYDCIYVACAIEEHLPLITGDKRLSNKFSSVVPAGLVNMWTFEQEV